MCGFSNHKSTLLLNGLRNYQVDGQIGLEETFEEYLDKMMLIFVEIKRVLKPTGQFWLNMGDCYGGLPAGNKSISEKNVGSDGLYVRKMKQCDGAKSFVKNNFDENGKSKYWETSGLTNPEYQSNRGRAGKDKCLLMQPERMAIRMIDELGFILRNKVKWAKQVYLHKQGRTIGSVMPTSVRDRFNESGEELYFFVKNKKYYSNLDAVRLKNQVLGVSDFRASEFVRSAELYPSSKYARAENQGSIDGRVTNHIKTLQERMADTKNKDTKSSRNYNMKKLLSEVRLGIKPNTGIVDDSELQTGNVKYDISQRQKELEKKGGLPINQRVQGFYDEFGGGTNPKGRNLPTIWQIGSEPHNFKRELNVDVEHFAAFPQNLCEMPIKFGCPKKICNNCDKIVE